MNDMGFNSYANVRFGDGVTSFKLYQAFYSDEKLVRVNLTQIAPVPKHQAVTIQGATADTVNMDGLTVKVFLWDQDYVPLIPASSEWSAGMD
jgi:hypothetical protein